MATGNVIVTVVGVGQGQCTFVEIYDDSDVLTHTLLFDCGTDKPGTDTYTNLDYVAAKAIEKKPPGFDAIFFSHSDKDHISLARYVLDKVLESKPSAKVNEVWYGGCKENYTKYSFNILNYIYTKNLCASKNIRGFKADSSDYDKASNEFKWYLWENSNEDVFVRALVANVVSDDPDWDESVDFFTTKTAEEKNRVSLIACLFYANASYVICGDATNRTMGAVNGLLSKGTTLFNNNIMTTLPHHGSRATGLAVKSGQVASLSSVAVVDAFATLMKSVSISISAYEKHRHPSLELMNRFIPTQKTPILRDTRLVQKNTHRITAYMDIDVTTGTAVTIFQGLSYSFESDTNTFSTRYSDWGPYIAYNLGAKQAQKSQGVVVTKPATAINAFACWGYTTASSGSTLVRGYANLALPLVQFTAAATSSLVSKSAEEMPLLAGEPGYVTEENETITPTFRVKLKNQAAKPPSAQRFPVQNKLKQYY